MKKILKKLSSFINKNGVRQSFFILTALVLFVVLVWFVIFNFVFLVDHLNRAFGTDFTLHKPEQGFDKEGFERLNLVK